MSEHRPEAPAVPGEPMVLPPDEFAALKSALEHAQAALAGDNEGVRLWMLDCGELGRTAYEAESAWLDEIMPGGHSALWDSLDPEERGVYQRIAAAVAAAERERIARLADRAGAVCTGDEGTSCFFSALIREGRP